MALKLFKNIFGSSQKDTFCSFGYQRHNQRRLEHLSSLNLPLQAVSVLEVGAGVGDHTSFYIDRGCRVVSTEGRRKNLKVLQARYPKVETRVLDLENPPDEFEESFDVVHCYGVLYHLENPARAIEFLAGCCRKMMLLETCVTFGEENRIYSCRENSRIPTQSVSGKGCRPTRTWIFNQLKKHFEFVYLPVTQPNHEEFPVEWSSPVPPQYSRAVFIASRQKLENPLLSEKIPQKQRRH